MNPVVAENARPGTPGWEISRLAYHHEIEGFAGRVSVVSGAVVPVFVSTTAARFAVHAYRMGYYGGVQARLVWQSAVLPGHRQAPAVIEAPTHTPVARWTPSLQLATLGWPPGDYLLRLDASSGWQSFIPLTVRSAHPPSAAVVLLNAVTTWQAYNHWGGYSLYAGPGGLGDFADRARAVSFDRPYDFGGGSADFLGNELPALSLAEQLGLRLSYATDVDLQADPQLLAGARAVISLGHDEYWSAAMRSAVTAARDRGVNVAFLGANAVFRQIRFAGTHLGPDRWEIDYKSAAEDPLTGRDDALVTVNWRAKPVSRPESSLTGTFYECNPVRADLVVFDPGNWLFDGTGVIRGTRLLGLLGSEYDRVDLSSPTPRPIEVLLHSPVRCHGRRSDADAAYYTVSSGAGVFDSGTSSWVCAITDRCADGRGDAAAARIVRMVTTNLFRAFAAGPAGRRHPARDNVAGLPA